MRARFRAGRAAAVVAALAAVAALAQAVAAPASAHLALHRTVITIDGARRGTPFQGVGAISGGGGNSRLLIDYPEPQRDQILNYLFKPGYGASVQILKLEVGGDAYATDGAEPSVEHARGRVGCGNGYEFWLAQQARKRDPAIQLYGLQWNAPGWIGGGHQDAWTRADIGYLLTWLRCARSFHLRINYLGGWNEHLPHGLTSTVRSWFERLRSALNNAGFRRVKIVAVDSFAHLHTTTDVADYLARYPRFRRVVAVLGYHNLCRYPASGKVCFLPAAARRLGKPVWESEIGALRQGTGVAAMARSLNNGYILVHATGFIAYPLIGSMPADLPEEDRGLVTADQPWSGHYRVDEMAWILAQTAAFTRPSWLHVRGANNELGGSYGSYVSYEAPGRSAWTLVAQTTDAPAAQTITVHLRGLPRSVVHVWSTDIRSPLARNWFVRRPDLRPRGGTFSFMLRRGFIYTFTSVRDPGRGHATSPAARPMPLPYTASRDGANEPRDLAAQDGAFEYLPGQSAVFEQTAAGRPVFWQNPVSSRFPYAVLGDAGWANYTVSASVSFTGRSQSAGLIARFAHPKADGIAQRFYGYQFVVSPSGAWRLLRDAVGANPVLLRSGQLATAPGTGTWTSVALGVHGRTLTGTVNGTAVTQVSDRSYPAGIAGICTGGWYPVKFRDLSVTS